jgi:hypothetical protein
MSAPKSDKKRKRQEEGGERPVKKKALAPPTGSVRVEYLENNDVLGPLLGRRSRRRENHGCMY